MSPPAFAGTAQRFDLALEEQREFPPASGVPTVLSDSDVLFNTEDNYRWALPGHGKPCDLPLEKDRPWRYKICPVSHYVPYREACLDYGCPKCWRSWLKREAARAVDKVEAESKARGLRGARWPVPVHVVLAPSLELWDSVRRVRGRRAGAHTYDRLRSLAYAVARQAGMDGGVVVFHHVRLKDEDDPETTEGPHFHVVGFGRIRPNAFAQTGWVVKNLGVRRTRARLVATLEYVLSHASRALPEAQPDEAGILPYSNSANGTEAVTWFGREVRAADVPSEGRYCPVCERTYPLREWMDGEWIGQGPPPDKPGTIDPSEWRTYALDRTSDWSGRRVEIAR